MQVPFYRQTLDFTCGPASLLMAMAAQDPGVPVTPAHEHDVWREATLAVVPATSRYGLALAAARRGFRAHVVTNLDGPAFWSRIEKRLTPYYDAPAFRELWTDRKRRALEAGVTEERREVTLADVDDALASGVAPILLTTTKHFDPTEDYPHWVVVARREGDGYLVHNPLDHSPPKVHLPAATMQAVLRGWEGDQELVLVRKP